MIITLPYKSYFYRWLDQHSIFKDNINNCNELTIDFQNVSFLEPKYIVLLSCFLEPYYRKNIKINFINTKPAVRNFLEGIDFFNYFNINTQRVSFNTNMNSSTISLWNITAGERFAYSNYAKTYFEQRFVRNKDLVFIQNNLEEIFNNIFDHAQSAINGFVITQYYPVLNKITFAVCDTGIGIPENIKNIKPNLLDHQSIEYSTQIFITTQSTPQNRGRGLNNIINLCHDQLGNVNIYSNKGFYYNNNPQLSKDFNVSFTGTLIDITINLDNLEEKSNDYDELDIFQF